ncbi:hypothetical protein [Pseudomonas aeruginosa]
MRQDPRITAEYEAITQEFSKPIQAAGLSLGLVKICANDAETPDQLRKMLVRQLQRTLPKDTPASIRADASQAPAEIFAKHEARVKTAIFEAAHESPTLRAVISKDQGGREQVEFYGRKSSWMGAFKAPARMAKTINGQPVRLPVVL